MLNAILHYSFMQHAFISTILVSFIVGIIGPIITEKKMVMITGGIAHSAFGGIGLGYMLAFPPIYGGLLFSVLTALGIGRIADQSKQQTDILIGIIWSVSMALGVVFIDFAPINPPDITSFLFGDILTVTSGSLWLMLVLSCVVFLIVLALFNRLQALLFDREYSAVQGEKTRFFDYLLLILIAMSVIILIRVVGFILILGLFTAPSAIARRLTHDFKKIMAFSILISLGLSILGLWFSYRFNVASGASITLFLGLAYFLVVGAVATKKKLLLAKARKALS